MFYLIDIVLYFDKIYWYLEDPIKQIVPAFKPKTPATKLVSELFFKVAESVRNEKFTMMVANYEYNAYSSPVRNVK